MTRAIVATTLLACLGAVWLVEGLMREIDGMLP